MHNSWLLLVIVGLVLPMMACGGGGAPVAPQPATVFTGPLEHIPGASSGTISLTVSEDGASITSVGITLTDFKCFDVSAGSFTKETGGVFPVDKGKFVASVSRIGKIDGRFTSPTEASGRIELRVEIAFAQYCKLGTQKWSAKAAEAAPPQATPPAR